MISSHSIAGICFKAPEKYTNLNPIGMGGFGIVCSGMCNGKQVAIKKIKDPFSNETLAKITFRELKILSTIRHDNVLVLLDAYEADNDLYFVTDFLSMDLGKILDVKNLEPDMSKFFFYQIIRGLKYIHSCNVIHRDLKPCNILVNADCELRISDFGSARVESSGNQLTGYVCTRYYRAPEIMLSGRKYNKAIDIWSAACILVEMLEGSILFPGKDHIDQFVLITKLLGFPKDLSKFNCSERTLESLENFAKYPPLDFSTRFSNLEPIVVDLLSKMLTWDPESRLSAQQVLEHPYLLEFHDPQDEPEADYQFDLSLLDKNQDLESWCSLIRSELDLFKEKIAFSSSS